MYFGPNVWGLNVVLAVKLNMVRQKEILPFSTY